MHGWRGARNPPNAVTAASRRHFVVMSGKCRRDGRSSWWFACQLIADLSAYVRFHFLPAPVRRK
eukprot:8629019-Alexandrium_andersonii.AAC.1